MSLPARIGKYPVTEELGRGAMGVVYRGHDPDIQRPVALKTLRKDLAEEQGPALLARLRNEARAAGRLAHPGIVGVYEFGEDDALAFIAMEYVRGASLREYHQRGVRLEQADIASLMVQLLDALAYAHDAGVVHRDIKPANLILTAEGRLKVADFGIARLSSSSLTQAGSVLGTPAYMAPEQYAGGTLDGRADLFSAGVLLYELLCGEKPFAGSTEIVAYRICFEPHPRLSQQAPGRGLERWDAVIDQALAKRPEERFASAAAFREALLASHGALPPLLLSARARILEGPAPGAADAPGTGSRSDSASLLTTLPPLAWDETLLRQVELQLARHLGPVARVLVRRAARGTDRLDTLYQALAQKLSGEAERRSFLAGMHALQGAPATTGAGATATTAATRTSLPPAASPPALPGQGLDPRLLEQAARHLAAHLGPIARVVVKKAAAQTSERARFHQLVAAHVEDAAERRALLEVLARDAAGLSG